MIDLKSRLSTVTSKEEWAARGSSFLAKVKATKVVWFPPKPEDAGKKAATTAKKASTRSAKKTSAAGKKATSTAKKTSTRTAKKTTAADKKT